MCTYYGMVDDFSCTCADCMACGESTCTERCGAVRSGKSASSLVWMRRNTERYQQHTRTLSVEHLLSQVSCHSFIFAMDDCWDSEECVALRWPVKLFPGDTTWRCRSVFVALGMKLAETMLHAFPREVASGSCLRRAKLRRVRFPWAMY